LSLEKVMLAHGGGGRATWELIEGVFGKYFADPVLLMGDDAAELTIAGGRLAFATDSFVVSPPFFPGGDVGRLAVCGSVNDLLMKGARPLYLSAAFIIEEGTSLDDLRRIALSMSEAASEAKIRIVACDTKVTARGQVDKIYIATSGVGLIPEGVHVGGGNGQPGDFIIVSGTLGEHGAAVLSQREGLGFETELTSDCMPLSDIVLSLFESGAEIHVLRDPTRGGIASTLNEIAIRSKVDIVVDESEIPLSTPVKKICELLGLDPLALPSEGKFLAFIAPKSLDIALKTLRAHPKGRNARVIGRVTGASEGRVFLTSFSGVQRVLPMPWGELIPRIC